MTEPQLIGGRYELGELLGRGGMAEVRKGRDTRLGRVVAIKRLRTDLASDVTFQARFRREAQSAASLNHPTIVSVYDTGEETLAGDQHVPYIVMEYVEGQTLRDVIRSGETLLPERALEIVSGVLRALAYSHHAGIVHRDIKPANVMLTPAGEIKVMDFGIARALADTSATMTQTAAVIGTAQYLSPEQARGAQVDARSDLYSTGCLLYELLTERPPFVGDSPVSVAYQHVREEAKPPSTIMPGLSPTIDAVVMRSLAKNPDDRYQSAEEMRADVERAIRGEQVSAAATQVAPASTAMIPTTTVAAAVPSQVGYASANPPPPLEGMIVQREYDDPEPPRSGRGTAWAIGILSVILVAALAFIGFQILGGGEDEVEPQETAVPVITGQTEEAAAGVIAAMAPVEIDGVQAQPFTLAPCTSEASSEVESGLIISQDPEAEALAANGTEITCVVSAGIAETTVPPLVGLSEGQVEAALTTAGLVLGDTDDQDGTAPRGQVLSSTPGEGEPIPAGAEVDIVIASGQNAVPSVRDLSQADAETAIRSQGFSVGEITTQETADVPEGTVIDQEPAASVVVDLGQAVAITVAVAPPVETTPVPDVSGGDLTYDAALGELEAAGFTDVSINEDESDPPCRNNPNEACFVIDQDPAAGEEFEDPGATPVTLVLRADEEGGRVADGAGREGSAVRTTELATLPGSGSRTTATRTGRRPTR